jgi:hypothetical protein
MFEEHSSITPENRLRNMIIAQYRLSAFLQAIYHPWSICLSHGVEALSSSSGRAGKFLGNSINLGAGVSVDGCIRSSYILPRQ